MLTYKQSLSGISRMMTHRPEASDEVFMVVVHENAVFAYPRLLKFRASHKPLHSHRMCSVEATKGVDTIYRGNRFNTRWFGHAARRPKDELIKDLLFPTPSQTWRRHGQPRSRSTWNCSPDRRMMEEGLGESLSSELAQDRRACSASVRDEVNSIGDAGLTRPG